MSKHSSSALGPGPFFLAMSSVPVWDCHGVLWLYKGQEEKSFSRKGSVRVSSVLALLIQLSDWPAQLRPAVFSLACASEYC